MSSATAHAPEHHDSASAAPSAAKTLHFNHGGVLGLTESIGRLLKGVTYDAAKETLASGAHPAPGHAADHAADHAAAHPTPDGAHPAPGHAPGHAAAHPAPAAGAHPTPDGAHPAPAAGGHAEAEDQDLSDKIISTLGHMGHYGAIFPFAAKGLKWVKDKLYPEIHEIATDDQHLGDQILHKLKKDKKAAKNGRRVLDHHALEGFAMGIDIPNIRRTLRMFADRERFNKALQSDSGREEIKKEIANILDLSGDVDLAEADTQTRMLLELLGVEFTDEDTITSVGGVDHHHWHVHTHRHELDSRVDAKHEALVQLIANVREFLVLPDVHNHVNTNLDTIYGTGVKVPDYPMDYTKIGDNILKLNNDTLRPFLNRVRKDGIDDMQVAVGDLLDPANVASELENNPDDLKAEISNLFNVTGKVTADKLRARALQMKAKLRAHPTVQAVDPYTATRDRILTDVIDIAVTNLTAGDTLAKLYGTEAQVDDFELNYAKLGDAMIKLTDKTRKPFLNRVEKDGIERVRAEVGDLLTAGNVAAELEHNPADLRAQVENLFNVGGKPTPEKLAARAEQLKTSLKALPAPAQAVDPYTATRDALVQIIDDAVTHAGTAAVLTKLYPNGDAEKMKFEWDEAKYKAFGATVLSTVTDKNRENALKHFDEDAFDAAFNLLSPTVKVELLDSSTGKTRLKEQVVAVLKLTEPFTEVDVTRQADAIRKRLGSGATEKAHYDLVNERLTRVVTAMNAVNIGKMFAGVSAVGPENFVNTFRDLEDKAEVAAYVRGYKSSAFRGHFPYLVSTVQLEELVKTGSPQDLNVAKQQVVKFVGINVAKVSEDMVKEAIQDFEDTCAKLVDADFPVPEDLARFNALKKDIADIKANLTAERLDQLFDRDNPYKNFWAQVMKVTDATRFAQFMDKMNITEVYASFNYMRNPLLLDAAMTPDQQKVAKQQLCSLLGFDKNVKPALAEVQGRVPLVENKLKLIAMATLRKAYPAQAEVVASLQETLQRVSTDLTQAHLDTMYA
jgi:hypothetical protein